MANRPPAADRGYDSRWRKARKAYLASHPHCVMCKEDGRTTRLPATVVDLIVPHNGNPMLFWGADSEIEGFLSGHKGAAFFHQ